MAQFLRADSTDGAIVLRVVGEIDLSTVEDLKAAVRPCFSESSQVELDLGGLEFMDSSGLGALVQLAREGAGRGSSLTLTNVTARTHRLLEISGLAAVLEARHDDRGPGDGDGV